jgi:hypothetical protein
MNLLPPSSPLRVSTSTANARRKANRLAAHAADQPLMGAVRLNGWSRIGCVDKFRPRDAGLGIGAAARDASHRNPAPAVADRARSENSVPFSSPVLDRPIGRELGRHCLYRLN